jgi:chitin disaccharide deacetylase
MADGRYLVVTADDYGIGPATSRGILELAEAGAVSASVLLVNSPHAESAVRLWRQAGCCLELGWHPCLTIDHPISPPDRVPSLVDAHGAFLSLGSLIRRLALGRIRHEEVEAEFLAQYDRFRQLTDINPLVVNTHHHIQIFSVIGAALRGVLDRQTPKPYLRRIREAWRTLFRVHGARPKRFFLNHFGRPESRRQANAGFPGNEFLAGITDPTCVSEPEFFRRWLHAVPGKIVELTCHPGHLDATLVGRDGSFEDGQIHRRAREWDLLKMPGFQQAIHDAGFTLVRPSQIAGIGNREESLRLSIPA